MHIDNPGKSLPVFNRGLAAIAFLTWAIFSQLAPSARAEDDHRVQFHAQGGSLNNVGKDYTEVVLVSKDPVTKAEALSLLDSLSEKLRRLESDSKVTKADLENAQKLIPKVRDWVKGMGPGGLKRGSGKTPVANEGNVRIDCEMFGGYYFVRDFPHSFEITVSGWDKSVTQRWSQNDSPGRKVGRDEFTALKSKMFQAWGIDPEKTDLKVRTAHSAWKDAREWFENVVLRDGIIEGDSKDKSIDKEGSEVGLQAKITLKIEVKMLTGIGFIEEE